MTSTRPKKRPLQQARLVSETAAAYEECVFKIVEKLETLIDLTKTLHLPKHIAEKYHKEMDYHKETNPRKRTKRKNSEINSGKVMLDQINELIELLASLNQIEGTKQEAIFVPQGIVNAIDNGHDPSVFIVDQVNSLLDRENVLRSRDDRFRQYEAKLQARINKAAKDEKREKSMALTK